MVRLERIPKRLIAVVTILGVCWLALNYFIPAPPSKITIATGVKGTTFDYFGQRYRARFARAGIRVELRQTAGALENLKLLLDPKSGVDIAFVTGGAAEGAETPELLSAGAAYPSPSWLFYSTSETIDSLPQLKGKRIAVGPDGSGARQTAERILSKANVNSSTATLLPLAGDDAEAALNDGRADAAYITSGSDAPAVAALLRNPRVRLMDFSSSAEALIRIFPDVMKVVLPKGAVELDPPNPPNDVVLIQIPAKVVFRENLHPAIVQLLAKTMKEEHDRAGLLQRVGDYPTSTDAEYTMSQVAVDYYKNGPSFLQGYLPLRMTVYAQRTIAFMIATLAVIFPVFGFAPRIYAWVMHEHVRKLYRRLRFVDQALQKRPGTAELETLQGELADIDRATHDVSLHNSELYFMLRYHLDRTHARLVEAGRARRTDTA